MAETLDLSLFVRAGDDGTPHMDLAVEGVGCAGCIRKIESGLKRAAGRHRRAAQLHQPPAGVDWRDDELDAGEVIAALESIGYRGASVRAGARRGRRGAPGALADALPRGRGLCRDEHHAAVGVGVVRQRHRHDAGDARPLPLAVGADRAAGGGLCRPAVLPQRLARAARARASTWTCRSRSA